MNTPPLDPSARTWFTLRQASGLAALALLMPSVLLPLYGREIGASVFQIGICFAAFPLAVLLVRRTVKSWGERWGWRACFLAGLGGHVLALLALAFAWDVGAVLLGRALQGAAWAFVWLSAEAQAGGQANGAVRLAQAQTRGALVGVLLGFALLTTGLSLSWHDTAGQNDSPGAWTILFAGYALVGFSALLRAWRGMPAARSDELHVPRTVEAVPGGNDHPIRWFALQQFVSLTCATAWGLTALLMVVHLMERLALSVDVLLWVFLPSAVIDAFAWPASPLASRLGRLAERIGPKTLLIACLVLAAVNSALIVTVADVVLLAVLWALQAMCLRLMPCCWLPGAAKAHSPAADLGAVVGPFGGALIYQGMGASASFYANGLLLGVCAVFLFFWLRRLPPNG